MPGTIDHSRPCTSTYFTPFRPYTEGDVIDYTICESATNNEIVLLSTAQNAIEVTLNAAFPVFPTKDETISPEQDGFTTFFLQKTVTLNQGVPEKISGLFAAKYTLSNAVENTPLENVLVSTSEMFINGAQPAFIQQTFPKQPFVVDSSFEMKPASEIFGISSSDFPKA